MWIDHPAVQGERVWPLRWLRYHLGVWMQRKGSDWEDAALHPDRRFCPECGRRMMHYEIECDHIPF